MKKILLLLLLCPLSLFAKFYNGSITLKDGSVKTGLVDVPRHSKSDKIQFKTDKKAKVQNLEIKTISAFSITTDDGNILNYITLKLSNPKTFSKEYTIDDEVSWVRVDHDSNLSIVVAFIAPALSYTPGEPVYYLHRKGDEHCSYITVFYANSIQIGEFKTIKKTCEIIFKEDCPQLSEELTKDLYKEKSLMAIVDLYNLFCAD